MSVPPQHLADEAPFLDTPPFDDDPSPDDRPVPARRRAGGRDGEMPATFERVPPQDLGAEQSVLGGMLLSKDAITDVTDVLQAADYYRPAHELVHLAILDLYGRGEPADPITVAGELTKRGELVRVGGPGYLHTLVNSVPTAANAGYYAAIVHERAVLRRLVESGQRIAGMGYAAEGDIGEIVDAAQAEIMGIHSGIEAEASTTKTWSQMVEEELLAEEAGPAPFLPLPYIDLEAGLQIEGGDLVVIGGRPAMGKSVMLVDIARHLAIGHGIRTLLYSLEMTHRQVVQRMIAAEARIALHHIRNREMTDDDRARRLKTIARIGEPPLLVDTAEEVNVARLRSRLRGLQSSGELPGALLVDYLQLLGTEGGKGTNRTNDVDELARGLKMIAKQFEIPVIVAAQIGRSSEQRQDKVPTMADLRESGGIEANASGIVLLHRPDYYEKESPRAGEADAIVAKNRMGSTFTATLAFQGHYSRFVDMTRDMT
ncbi:replicative DNA helicase [Kitasatospora sp. NPDC059327]|uniref:replicative DNA helicase n=1 Tax=Kitasatospora sp. NPDC059327 TaxID=3346803 RepID=UPI003688D4E8